ncbi:ATP synthase subunit I [Desulfuromonas sp. KJ2020]|uniref:ATP synthase subunit I n=1 Tax=Desulfuromonas sp. KJ2020 TaxID=2919173 RepID=UPI000323F87D|nr:ATP synthase subunit I [Desulfuromonas sp. KJ2020]MCP3176294.1 ATP synthase subunit I [Desulfuromonas sp. KJ2020]
MNDDTQLLRDLSRRNWLILGILVALSSFSTSLPFVLGVLTGGLVAITGYHWLHFSLKKLIGDPQQQSARGFKLSYFIRLGALAASLVVLIVVLKVHPVGLALGLSVVVINIMWTTLKRSF